MKKFVYFLSSWLPPLILMGIIFYLSSSSRPSLTNVATYDWGFYKIVHFCAYATIYAAFFRAFYRTENHDLTNVFVFSLMATVLFAASDELHQTYVPGRDGNPIDVGIDTLGASFVYFFIKGNFEKIKKFL